MVGQVLLTRRLFLFDFKGQRCWCEKRNLTASEMARGEKPKGEPIISVCSRLIHTFFKHYYQNEINKEQNADSDRRFLQMIVDVTN